METKTHTVFFQFTCGHEFYDSRVPGGVSDWDHCLCNSCQPYHAVLFVDHPCRSCGGSLDYFRDGSQVRLSEEEAQRRMEHCAPLIGPRAQVPPS